MAINQGAEDSGLLTFRWTIGNFSALSTRKLYSKVFSIDDSKWRILVFPKGNGVDCLSLYLSVADSPALPVGWTRPVSFSLAVVDQLNGTNTITQRTEHKFKSGESEKGFTSFMTLPELHDPQKGYIVNGTCIIEAGFSAVGDGDAKLGRYTDIMVARDEDLAKQIGKTRYFDLVDHDIVHCFRFEKQTPFLRFKEEVANVCGIPVPFQRFWMWVRRKNQTYRPLRPLTALEEAKCVGQVRETSNEDRTRLRLFLEVSFDLDRHPIAPPHKTEEDILVFFKVFEPEKENLCYIGRLFVKLSSKPRDILASLNQMARFAPNVEIELYEEIKFHDYLMCEPIDKDAKFRSSELQDGDIICFQKSPLRKGKKHKYPNIPSFLQRIKDLKVDPHGAFVNAVSSESFFMRLLNQSTVEDAMELSKTEVTPLEDTSKSEACCIQHPKASSLFVEHTEVPESPAIELVEFMGMGKIEKAFVPLLEEVCSWHPILIECQKNRSILFTQWAFTALGRVLYFLKNAKAKDMSVIACDKLQLLWEELETCRFDLSWLEPHVQSALGMRMYLEKSERVKELQDKVTDLKSETKRLKSNLDMAYLDLDATQMHLFMAKEGFEERDVNGELGYGYNTNN